MATWIVTYMDKEDAKKPEPTVHRVEIQVTQNSGKPHLFNARGPAGWGCSAGHFTPRWAIQSLTQGLHVLSIKPMYPGFVD